MRFNELIAGRARRHRHQSLRRRIRADVAGCKPNRIQFARPQGRPRRQGGAGGGAAVPSYQDRQSPDRPSWPQRIRRARRHRLSIRRAARRHVACAAGALRRRSGLAGPISKPDCPVTGDTDRRSSGCREHRRFDGFRRRKRQSQTQQGRHPVDVGPLQKTPIIRASSDHRGGRSRRRGPD
jgi:hypothetical protein